MVTYPKDWKECRLSNIGNYSLAPWHAVHGLSLEDIVNHLRIKKFMKMLIFYDIIGSFIVCETAKGG